MTLVIILFLLGFLILGLEVFLPTGGILGVISAVLLITSIVLAFMQGVVQGVVVLGVTTILLPIALGVFVKIYPYTPIGRRMILEPPEAVLPEDDGKRDLIGKRGVARSKMLPSGSINIDGQVFDAVSDGMAVEEGDRIEVVAIRNNNLVVRPVLKRAVDDASDDILSQSAEQFGIDSFDDDWDDS